MHDAEEATAQGYRNQGSRPSRPHPRTRHIILQYMLSSCSQYYSRTLYMNTYMEQPIVGRDAEYAGAAGVADGVHKVGGLETMGCGSISFGGIPLPWAPSPRVPRVPRVSHQCEPSATGATPTCSPTRPTIHFYVQEVTAQHAVR